MAVGLQESRPGGNALLPFMGRTSDKGRFRFRFRLRVVSVLISVTTDMSPTGDLLVTLIFVWGDDPLGLPMVSHVSP